MVLFDKKFGTGFLQTVPISPGTYQFRSASGDVLYVGKAKSLRRRLQQYRAARSGKMRKIVKAASELLFETEESELDACLAELRQIQAKKPKLNIASNFSHRYPFLGLRTQGTDLHLLFTTTPHEFPGFNFFGAYRSRFITAEAFFGLVRLLQFIGHPISQKRENKKRYSYEFGLRKLPLVWTDILQAFLRGSDSSFLAVLFETLLERAAARAKAAEVQEAMDALVAFWEKESAPLARVIEIVGFQTYPVPQTDRDPLFIRAGFELRTEDYENP
jgi:hypothetical protein